MGDEHANLKSTIQRNYNDCQDCCDEMFKEWCNLFPHRTWNDLITALKSHAVRKVAVALKMEGKM